MVFICLKVVWDITEDNKDMGQGQQNRQNADRQTTATHVLLIGVTNNQMLGQP